MRIHGWAAQQCFQFSFQFRGEQVLQRFGVVVHVVSRQVQLVGQVGLPQTVASDDGAGGFGTGGR